MGEEALVLGGHDGLAQDERHLVVGHDPAVLPGQLDQDRAASVADDAGRGGLEPDERLEVGHAGAVEVHVVDQPRRREQRQHHGEERNGEEHARRRRVAVSRAARRRATRRRAKSARRRSRTASGGLAGSVSAVRGGRLGAFLGPRLAPESPLWIEAPSTRCDAVMTDLTACGVSFLSCYQHAGGDDGRLFTLEQVRQRRPA